MNNTLVCYKFYPVFNNIRKTQMFLESTKDLGKYIIMWYFRASTPYYSITVDELSHNCVSKR